MPEFPKNSKKPMTLDAAAPKIPGVPAAKPKKPVTPKAPGAATQAVTKPPAYLWAAAGAALLIVIAAFLWWTGGSKEQAKSFPVVSANSHGSAEKPLVVQSLTEPPVGPGVIATTEELTQAWSAKRFYFRKANGKKSPAMVVRLPDNSYWAFSLLEPYGTCELKYVTDLDELRTQYGFTATHPMIGDLCTHTVFDLAQYGSGPSGEVRGEIVSGPGVRPPLAIEVEVSGTKIIATREEADILH